MRIRLIGCTCALAAAAFLNAQISTKITGSVVDSSGAAIPDASIKLALPGTTAAAYATTTSTNGSFILASISPATYDMVIDKPGFAQTVVKGVVVDPDRSTDVPPVRMKLASTSETIEVKADQQNVNTSNDEVGQTIGKIQMQNLPVADRSPLGFLQTQAGINNAAGSTTVNGQRSSYVNVTVDGINVQDNFIRANDVDFLPNLLLLDQVAEVSVTTSNASSAAYGGSAQIAFVTPSGGNKFHGQAYWQNRNDAFAANGFFSNQAGVKLPFLNQNQMGGSIGGPIKKNKLFFYANYEALRLRQQAAATTTILTDSARNGIFSYVTPGGGVSQVNILQAAGINVSAPIQAILAKVPASSNINTFNAGDSLPGTPLNTGGFSFNQQDNRTRDNITIKGDYILSEKNQFSLSFLYNRDLLDRPDVDTTYDVVPNVTNNDHTKLLSGSWRSTPTSTITNEARFGFNLAPALFPVTGAEPGYFLTGESFTNPENTFLAQGRFTHTYNYSDNATWVRGAHTFTFGFQGQAVRIEQFNAGGIIPSYGLGVSTAQTIQLNNQQLPGANANQVANANTLLASLGGLISTASQTYNVTSRTSGFVPNAQQIRNDRYNNYAAYFQDNWKLAHNLTATLGVRWEYYTPVDEANALALLPVIPAGSNYIQTVLNPNTELNFAGSAVGRPWYNADKHEFAPNIGLAWDPTGRSNFVVRAGYSINYVNDSVVTAANNAVATNAGLQTSVSLVNLTNQVAQGVPTISAPAFQVPITLAQNYAVNPAAALALPNPNLVTPYVQQWNVGVQRTFKGWLLDVRYVGNHGTKEIRGVDFNQVQIGQILPNFQQAYQNGVLSLQKTAVFRPAYNPNISGSQPLPFFNQLPGGGLLTNSTVITDIQTQQVGALALIYQENGLNGPFNFFANPNILGGNVLENYSNSDYEALQVDLTHRFANGFQFQANFVWSQLLSDAEGTAQTDFEPFLDNNNAKIERHRPEGYSLPKVFKANGLYELPFGPKKHFNPGNQFLQKLVGGWNVAGILTWQTGSPYSILSGRSTLNRSGRSANETANTNLTIGQLESLFQVHNTGNGPFIASQSIIGTDGRAVGPDGGTPFAGEVFTNPGAGQIGTLQRADLTGPWVSDLDAKISKNIVIRENKTLEFRMDALNAFNHASWFVPDQNVNSPTFGKITQTYFAPRTVQFSLYFKF
jgi:hypothetical protein